MEFIVDVLMPFYHRFVRLSIEILQKREFVMNTLSIHSSRREITLNIENNVANDENDKQQAAVEGWREQMKGEVV